MASELPCVQILKEESNADFASQQPWLLITDGQNRRIQNNMFNHKHCYYDLGGEIPEFLGRTIACFCQEWVLLIGSYDDGLPHVLVNLLSKETMELPLLDFEYDFCILTSPPYDPTCHVVFFKKVEEENGEENGGENENGEENGEEEDGEEENGEEENGEEENGEEDHEEEEDEDENSFIIWKPGDMEFTIKRWDYNISQRIRAVVAGKLFIEHNYRRDAMVMVEFKESECRFESIQMDSTEIKYLSGWNQYFWCDGELRYYFEYSGDLFSVYKMKTSHYSSNVAGFKIFKADILNKKWVRVQKLERVAIFLGSETAHAHCAAVDSGIAANSIYFLEEDDLHSYYVYNLEEGTITMKPIFSSMETTEDTELDWIMMPCHLSSPKLLKERQESIRQDSEEENGEVEQDDEVQESWNMVPPELLNLIQLCLFGRDHAVFRGVCKSWKQASIQDYSIPSLLSPATLLEQCETSSPLLMYQEDRTSSSDSVPTFRFFDPVHRKLYRIRIPELKEADIHYSRDGWLLVSRRSDQSIFFFNPLTQEKIELPRLPPRFLPPPLVSFADFLSFSSPPTCSNCLVVGMDRLGSEIYTLKHGDETWKEHDLLEASPGECMCNIVLNGLHYFMCENRDLVIFNLENGAEIQSPDRQIFRSKFRQSESFRGEDFLVEIDGGPAFVSVGPNGGNISIYKWNDVEKDWELMEGGVEFGGKDMFLSKRCSFMEKIDDDGGMGNTIFLPMIDESKDGVFYSFATRKYHTFYSGYSSELPYDADKFLDGIWVKPDRKSGSCDRMIA